jgi:transcription elongation factor
MDALLDRLPFDVPSTKEIYALHETKEYKLASVAQAVKKLNKRFEGSKRLSVIRGSDFVRKGVIPTGIFSLDTEDDVVLQDSQ